MADALTRDAEALRRALDKDGDEVELTLSRQTVEWLTEIVNARSHGRRIVVMHGQEEATPSEAAKILGVSRPQVRRFMEEGKLDFRMVGTHHRIPLASLAAFKEWERAQMRTGVVSLSKLQNELGLVE